MRASTVTGFGTAPPNDPECRSPLGPTTSSCTSTMPRMPTQTGVAAEDAGVADHDDVAVEPVAVRAEQLGEVHRARLLLALDDDLEVHRGRGAPGGREVRAEAEHVEEDLALVVDGAAPDQLLAVRRGAHEGLNGAVSHSSTGSTGCTSWCP